MELWRCTGAGTRCCIQPSQRGMVLCCIWVSSGILSNVADAFVPQDLDSAAEFLYGSVSQTIRVRTFGQWPLVEAGANHSKASHFSVFIADGTKSEVNVSVAKDNVNSSMSQVVDWQPVKTRSKSGRLAVYVLYNKSDLLFGGRRVVLLGEDRPINNAHEGSLIGMTEPYHFDDVVTTARMMINPKKRSVPTSSDVFTPRFMLALREGASCHVHASRPDFFETNASLNVAMHVRRGDVDHNNKHYLPDSYFTSIASALRGHYPNANIHAFSSTEKKCQGVPKAKTMEDCERGELLYNQKSFLSFTMRNISVHLDGDTHVAWSHFIRADVFVMSPSGFSNPPGFLNEKCVVWTESNWTPMPLPHWITTRDLNNKAAVKKCLKGPSY